MFPPPGLRCRLGGGVLNCGRQGIFSEQSLDKRDEVGKGIVSFAGHQSLLINGALVVSQQNRRSGLPQIREIKIARPVIADHKKAIRPLAPMKPLPPGLEIQTNDFIRVRHKLLKAGGFPTKLRPHQDFTIGRRQGTGKLLGNFGKIVGSHGPGTTQACICARYCSGESNTANSAGFPTLIL